jgi:hypothetical protein
MPHSFTIKATDEISELLRRVEAEITGSGGSFSGNLKCGSFNGISLLGAIRGEYRCISKNEINITITNKPFIVPYGKIETEIKKYFS